MTDAPMPPAGRGGLPAATASSPAAVVVAAGAKAPAGPITPCSGWLSSSSIRSWSPSKVKSNSKVCPDITCRDARGHSTSCREQKYQMCNTEAPHSSTTAHRSTTGITVLQQCYNNTPAAQVPSFSCWECSKLDITRLIDTELHDFATCAVHDGYCNMLTLYGEGSVTPEAALPLKL